MPDWTCGRLAAWGTAYLCGAVPLDDAVGHVLHARRSFVRQAQDTRTRAPWDDPLDVAELVAVGEAATVGQVLTGLRSRRVRRIFAAFPIPGHTDGVGPGPALLPAHDAGQAALLPDLGLVVVPNGGDEETYELAIYPNPSTPQPVTTGEAQHDLTVALHAATDTLTALDVPSWDPDAGRRSHAAIRRAAIDALPPGCPPRASHLLLRAEQLATVLAHAAEDHTGAISSHEATSRAAVLQPLARQVSRALSAAYNSAGD